MICLVLLFKLFGLVGIDADSLVDLLLHILALAAGSDLIPVCMSLSSLLIHSCRIEQLWLISFRIWRWFI